MSTPTNPRREHPNTYFVQDRSNKEDLTRLQIQDQLFTTSMGGVLPEQSDTTLFRRVLDVGCGPGGWLIAAARTSALRAQVGSSARRLRDALPTERLWAVDRSLSLSLGVLC